MGRGTQRQRQSLKSALRFAQRQAAKKTAQDKVPATVILEQLMVVGSARWRSPAPSLRDDALKPQNWQTIEERPPQEIGPCGKGWRHAPSSDLFFRNNVDLLGLLVPSAREI